MTFPDVPIPNQWGNTGDPAESLNRVKMNQRVDINLNLLQARVAANKLLTTAIAAWGAGGINTPPAGSQLQIQFGSSTATTSGSGVLTIALPQTFPNGIGWWWASPVSPATAPVARSAVTGTSTSQIVFTVYSTTVTSGSLIVLASTSVTALWLAVGY